MENPRLLSHYHDFVDQIREYLLTVKVARQLVRWNAPHLYHIRALLHESSPRTSVYDAEVRGCSSVYVTS